MWRKSNLDKYLPDQQDILRAMGSKHIGERLDVEHRLREMGPQGAELLLEFLKDEAVLSKRKRRAFVGALSVSAVSVACIAVVILLTRQPLALVGLSGFSGLAGFAALLAPSQRYHQIINALSQMDDVRAVGPLAEALSLQDINSRVAVARALERLLPRLEIENADLLDSPQRAALHKLLNTGAPEKESRLMLTIVNSLSRIQDTSALATMEILANRTPQTANERLVVEAAAESVVVLREAKHRLETPQTLLRASAQDTPAVQLLRAAHQTSDTPVEQLLRADSGTDG